MPGKIFINETADKQKVELTTGSLGVTGGYYDPEGVWHDFGGGGSNLQPILHMTITLSPDSTYSSVTISPEYHIVDGNMVAYSGSVSIDRGESYSFDTLVLGDEDSAFIFEGESLKSVVSTDNCTVEDDEPYYYVEVTDPSKEASASVIIDLPSI